jgi:2-oxoglutarate dehydrogenase E2 component (dihydrolipoamide succinyltransferase)
MHQEAVYGLGLRFVSETAAPAWRERASRETRRFLSPAVRRLSKELRIDAGVLLGRGRGGRVTRDDVLAASGPSRDEVVPFDNIRKRTAVALAASKRDAAHAVATIAADYSRIDAARQGAHLTALPFVARAVVDALREYPVCNATVTGDFEELTLHRAVHLGIAVDLEFKGLVVPVVRNADGLRLTALADNIRYVARRARARQLTPDDLAGGTFTITNPGASGTWISMPIINRPQVAILSTDGVAKQVIAEPDGSMRIAPIGHLCLSFDHRALDGAYAGAFLGRVRQIMETRDWNTEL